MNVGIENVRVRIFSGGGVDVGVSKGVEKNHSNYKVPHREPPIYAFKRVRPRMYPRLIRTMGLLLMLKAPDRYPTSLIKECKRITCSCRSYQQ